MTKVTSHIIQSIVKELVADPTRRILVVVSTQKRGQEVAAAVAEQLVVRGVVIERYADDGFYVKQAPRPGGPGLCQRDLSLRFVTPGGPLQHATRIDEAVGFEVYDDVWETPWWKHGSLGRMAKRGRGVLR